MAVTREGASPRLLNGCAVASPRFGDSIGLLCHPLAKSKGLQQEGLDTVGVDHLLAGRPGKDRETAVLRRDERDAVALIVCELRGGQVTRPTEVRGIELERGAADNRLGHRDLLDLRRSAAARDLRTEGEQL